MTQPFYVTEKADGSSCTAWIDEDGLHVASRTWELHEKSKMGAYNIYWVAARKYRLQNLPIGTAVQFEVVGPGVQGNPMGLQNVIIPMHQMIRLSDLSVAVTHAGGLEGRLFGAFVRAGERWMRLTASEFPSPMPHARRISVEQRPHTADELRKLADIKYPNGQPAEGIVVRAEDQSWSFKVLNLAYREPA
jgi:hypothetical protein